MLCNRLFGLDNRLPCDDAIGDMARADGIAAAMLGSEQIRRSLQMFDFFTRLGSPHERTHTLSWLID